MSTPPERVVITASEVEQAGTTPSPRRDQVPWWAILITSILALCLPLLCLFAIGVRVALRGREADLRAAWTRLLCTVLVISGLASSIAWSYLWFLRFDTAAGIPGKTASASGHLDSLDRLAAFAQAPAHAMTSVELAAWSKPLVMVVTNYSGIGAAMLLLADDRGYLFGTNRHVVDETGPLSFTRKRDRVTVVTQENDSASAEVAGRHRTLDLALLWTPRKSGSARYLQAIAAFRSIPVGEPIYVIGHPQRLFFTLSNGLVSRLSGSDILQISAPISPGNSGGPAYDALGTLLGVVTYKMDRESNPNAENLNFAMRADAFLSENGWDLTQTGRAALARLAHPVH